MEEKSDACDNGNDFSLVAHLPQVHNLQWTDDFFQAIPAACAVFDLREDATLCSSSYLYFPFRLCHLALTQVSVIAVFRVQFLFCGSTTMQYDYIPLESIAEARLEGRVIFLSCDKRMFRITGLLDAEPFDHALLALQEDFYRKKSQKR